MSNLGGGASTIWLSNNSNAEVHGVDSSKEWIDFVKARINSQTTQFHHIDLGPLESHGTPITYDRLESFESYSNSIWRQTANAKLVLVYGRFRVACFIKALMNTSFATNIIFDDYFSRPQYSIVENLLLPTNRCTLFFKTNRSIKNWPMSCITALNLIGGNIAKV